MKKLKDIKLKIANELSYEDSADLLMEGFNSSLGNKEKFVDLVAKEYAKQMCEHQKQICNDNAVLNFKSKVTGKDDIGFTEYRLLSGIVSIHSNSILNAPLATDNK